MAQLKDSIVSGNLRVTNTTFSDTVQVTKIKAPTTSGGTTYGPGTSGQVLKSNGTSIYWASDSNTDTQVTQSSSTSTQYRPVILGYTNTTTIADLANTVTNQVYATTNLFVKPSAGELHIGHQLYGDGSTNSTRVEVPLIGHNGTNIWIGSTAQQAAHFLGKIHISTGYDSGNSIGNPTAWLDIPNADNTNATASAILHTSYILHTTTSNANTWENLGCGTSAVSTYLHVTRGGDSANTVPACWAGQDSSGLIYGRGTTRGYISQAYNTPKVTLGGGRIDSSHTGPEWYFSITGATNTTYDLNNIPKVTQNVLETTDSNNYPLLLSNYNTSSTTTTAATTNRSMDIYANSYGMLHANYITASCDNQPYVLVYNTDSNKTMALGSFKYEVPDPDSSDTITTFVSGLYHGSNPSTSTYLDGWTICRVEDPDTNGYGTFINSNLYTGYDYSGSSPIAFFNGIPGNWPKELCHSSAFELRQRPGSSTSGSTGSTILYIGNSIPTGYNGNMEAEIFMYGANSKGGILKVDPNVSTEEALTEWVLPPESGTLCIADDTGSATQPVYINGHKTKAVTQPASGAWFSAVPKIDSSGFLEIGRYIDFHATNAATSDYDIRLDASDTSLLTLTSASGTPALRISGTLPKLRFTQTTSGKEYDNANCGITAFAGVDAYGVDMTIQSGDRMIIGGGEYPTAFYNLSDKGYYDQWSLPESCYIGADNVVVIHTNYSTPAQRKSFVFTGGGNFAIPESGGLYFSTKVASGATAGVYHKLLHAAGTDSTVSGFTARTWTLPDKSGDIATTNRGGTLYFASYGNTYWGKVLSVVINAASRTVWGMFIVSQAAGSQASSYKGAGIIQISCVTDSNKAVNTNNTRAMWLVAGGNVAKANFKLVAKNNTPSTGSVTFELWIKNTAAYHVWSISPMIGTDSSNSYTLGDCFTYHDARDANATTTTPTGDFVHTSEFFTPVTS